MIPSHAAVLALLDRPDLDEADLVTLGRALRAAHRDEDDPENDVATWASLVERLSMLPARARRSPVEVPRTPLLDELVGSLRGDPVAVAAEAERLGATALAESFLGVPRGPASQLTRLFADSIAKLGHAHDAALFPFAEAALRVVCEVGAHPDGDGVLLSLSDRVALRLDAALRGAPVDPVRDATWPRTTTSALAEILARALGRVSIELSDEVFVLPEIARAPSELTLHDAASWTAQSAVGRAQGIELSLVGAELVVRFDEPAPELVALVPLRGEVPGEVLLARGGGDERERVITLPAPRPDGFALVAGERVLLLWASPR